MNTTVRLTERSGSTSSQRRKGFVPVVVYGAGSDSQSFTADAKTITGILANNPRAVLTLELPDSGKRTLSSKKSSASQYPNNCCILIFNKLI